MYGPHAGADTIYGCGNRSRTPRRRYRRRCRPIRSRAPSRVRWATFGTRRVSPSAPRRASSAPHRRSSAEWRTRATFRRSDRSRGSRRSTATSWGSTSRRRARRCRSNGPGAPARRKPRPGAQKPHRRNRSPRHASAL